MALILPAQRLTRPNPLAYPAGAKPGFDPSHPAAKNMSPGHGLSAVANSAFQDGTMLNLLTGELGVTAVDAFANPGFMNGYIGPSVVGHGASVNSITFPGNAAVVDTKQTLAAIFYYNSAHTDNPVLIGSGSVFHNAFYIYVDGATKTLRSYCDVAESSLLLLTTNTPYFVVFSSDGANVHVLARSLSTGVILSVSYSGSNNPNTFTSSGTYTVQSDTFGNQAVFPVAAVSYTPAFLTMPQLMKWGADPWAFWYPNQTISSIGSISTVQYAAFSIPQRDGQIIGRMVGY